MSAVRRRFGARAVKSCPARSGADLAVLSWRVSTARPVRRWIPARPAWRISRVIRSRPTCAPSVSRRSACVLGGHRACSPAVRHPAAGRSGRRHGVLSPRPLAGTSPARLPDEENRGPCAGSRVPRAVVGSRAAVRRVPLFLAGQTGTLGGVRAVLVALGTDGWGGRIEGLGQV